MKYAKMLKCEFWLQELDFLSHVLSGGRIVVDRSKIEVEVDFSTCVGFAEC